MVGIIWLSTIILICIFGYVFHIAVNYKKIFYVSADNLNEEIVKMIEFDNWLNENDSIV